MPTYEYHCDACGDEFEKDQRITEPAGAVCPDCGSPKTHRLISHTSFVLKGSGWYVTDYARKGSNGSGGSSRTKPKNGGSASTSEKKSGSGAESTSAASSSSKAESGTKSAHAN